MRSFLLDTNVLSEFNRKGQPDLRVQQWVARTDTATQFVSIITIGEIRFGIELLPPSKRRMSLEHWLQNDLHLWFGDRILAIDQSIVNRWAALMAMRQLQGKPLDILDGLIAATALQKNLTLATRNVKDFDGIGVEVFDPWSFRV